MRGGAKRRPVVLYQPSDDGSVMPLSLLALGSWLAGEHVVIVDGRFELAPEARIVELARVALCLGVTVRTGAPLREAARVSAAARAANPGLKIVWGGAHATLDPASCLSTGTVDACALGAGEEAMAAAVEDLRGGRDIRPRAGLALAREDDRPAGRRAGSGHALAARRLLAARRRAALREPRGASARLLLEPRGEGRAGLDGDPGGAGGGRGGAPGRAVPSLGDPLPGRGLLRRPGAGGRDRAGPRRRRRAARLAGGGAAAGRRGLGARAPAPPRAERLPQDPPGRGPGRAPARAPDGSRLPAARGPARGALRLRRGAARRSIRRDRRRGRGGPVALRARRELRDLDPSRVDAGACSRRKAGRSMAGRGTRRRRGRTLGRSGAWRARPSSSWKRSATRAAAWASTWCASSRSCACGSASSRSTSIAWWSRPSAILRTGRSRRATRVD